MRDKPGTTLERSSVRVATHMRICVHHPAIKLLACTFFCSPQILSFGSRFDGADDTDFQCCSFMFHAVSFCGHWGCATESRDGFWSPRLW